MWDGVELLNHSMKSVDKGVDVFIIVYQKISNFGEYFNPLTEMKKFPKNPKVVLIEYEPAKTQPWINETNKRNIGLEAAKKLNCTHFFHIDCDEIYSNFPQMVLEYIRSGADGSVCEIYTYFKSPKLRLENVDNYFVPFIHKLYKNSIAGKGGYPYRVDPTRKINCSSVAVMNEKMHHFSWVRLDIERKFRNSTANKNLVNSKLLRDYFDENTKAGTFLVDYNQKLISVDDRFNISPIFI